MEVTVFVILKLDGFVKRLPLQFSETFCCISKSFNVREVRLMITRFARPEFKLFTKPSKSNFV